MQTHGKSAKKDLLFFVFRCIINVIVSRAKGKSVCEAQRRGISMNIIIVGCGKVGQTLASELNEEGNNITVIDKDSSIVSAVAARYDVMGVVGNGATASIQAEAGIDSADLLIAVTGSDELNLLCCMVAKRKGHTEVIARLKNPDYSTEADYLKNELGLAMVINPEEVVAEEIARVLRFPSATKIETFAKGRVEMVTFRLPEGSPLAGLSVREIAVKLRADVLICTVERGDEVFIAKGDLVFEEKDVISLIASPRNANAFFSKIKYKTHAVKDALLIGGSETTEYLARALTEDGIAVKIIEADKTKCELLADALPEATVIYGDLSEREVLLEEGIDGAGAVAALTKDDEDNIFLSLFAKSISKAKLVTKINRTDFDNVIKHLDLDSVVYPENITADMILRYVRATKNAVGSNVETLYNVIKGKVEAAEFIVKENSPVIGIPLSKLAIKPDILIAAILRGNRVIIPRGNDTVEAGDSVVIVSGIMALHDISDILK